MSKKVNFVFDWIGPFRPIPNNTVPNIIDLAFATGRADIKRNPGELQAELQNSDCYDFLKKMPRSSFRLGKVCISDAEQLKWNKVFDSLKNRPTLP